MGLDDAEDMRVPKPLQTHGILAKQIGRLASKGAATTKDKGRKQQRQHQVEVLLEKLHYLLFRIFCIPRANQNRKAKFTRVLSSWLLYDLSLEQEDGQFFVGLFLAMAIDCCCLVFQENHGALKLAV